MKPTARRKIRIRRRIFLIAAIAAAAVLCVYLLMRFAPGISRGNGPLIETGVTLPEESVANSNGIVYMDAGTLHLMSMNGEEIWNLPVDMPSGKLAASDQLVCAYQQKSMKLVDYTKQDQFSTTLDTEIDRAACGVDHVALQTTVPAEDGGEQQIIYILDKTNKQSGQIDFPSKRIVDFGFSGETDSFWVLALDSSGIVPSSYILSYKYDGVQTNTIEVNTQIVQEIFMTDTLIYASGTSSMVSYTKFGQKENEILLYGWSPEAESIGAESAIFAFTPISATHSLPMTQIVGGDLTEKTIHLPQNVLSLAITGEKLYAFATDEIHTYSTEGRLEKTDKLSINLSGAKQISNDCALVWDVQQRTYIMRLN